ncbi:alkaline phosphatase PafA [Arundinibacter roseus]|uniref:Alkaline phosphatase family protein n=1 Tax=Arundinibacter roseus TaxID=2070510 RepID=A0A4R4K1W1_9BACT|nr:alkaline phosphatase PafA [Arundinibacter roseus]TDB61193.1 alkaline phosphatase family protein [Arundinibacter roseus]
MATLIGTEGFAQTTAKKSTASPLARPKLVVGIVVDQMRYDYLYRYYDKYGEGGFKRLMNEGYNCRNNHYSYALTVTAAGHASVYTGSIPAINGIVGNNWYDNLAGKDMYCAEDPSVETVGSTNATAGKMSPRNLLSTTITDQLQIATNFRSKTVGVAIKDRGAILPAGHTASGAYWFDSKTGNWITSTFYTKELPQWVQDVNARKLPSEYMKKGWNTLLPINQYEESTGDDQPYETRLSGAATSTFPYDLAGRSGDAFGIIASTPWGNTMTKEMAMAAIKGENMGKGSQTDFLAVSFSSPDYVGHAFGPNSIEIEDVYLRLDQEFAEFFAFLDSWTGKGNYTVFLTADHGVMDIPAFWTEHRLPAGLLDNSKIKNAMATAIKEEFGEGEFVKANENYQIYFDHKTLKSKGIEVEDLYDVVREVLLPIPGIADVVNLKDLGETHLNSYQLELYKNGTHATRSGDLQIVTQPGWISGRGVGTTHGSPYNYDTHVPLLFYGWGVNKGETLRRTAIADIAPTLAGILRILPPNGSVGEPVLEAVKK